MNNQAPSRRAPIIQFLFNRLLCSRTAAYSSRTLSFLLRTVVSKREKKRETKGARETRREKEREKGVDTSKDKEEVGALGRRGTAGERRETGCGTAIIVAFPTDKVTAREYFLFPAADRARITRKES